VIVVTTVKTIYLYTENVKIVDAVFARTLKLNMLGTVRIELFRKRENERLISIFSYDLVIIDEAVNELELAKIAKCGSLPEIIRVNRDCDDLNLQTNKIIPDLELEKLKCSLDIFLNDLAS
jgi:hypothetical protein